MVGYAGSGDPPLAPLYSGAGTLEEASHELFRIVPEVTIVHLALTVLTVFITFFGLFSGFVKERLYVGEAIIATLFGIAFSGYAAGIFAPRTWSEGHHFDEITLELTRIVIALSVFAVGVELPKAYVLRHWKSLSILLGPVMLLGWMISGALMYAIIPGLDFLPALVVAAGVTPTDPILASSVVGKGKFAQEHVPAHIRHLLQAESGSNDGAAFPFLYLALFLLMREQHSIGETIGYWIALVILYQIVLGIVIGALVGIAARKLLKFSKRRELIDRESMVAMYVALALLVTGLTTLAGSDDLLAAFACGTAFAWDDWFTESIEESNFSSTIDLLANCAMFIYLGATMPFSAWNNASLTLSPWRLVVLAIAILALRRLPTIFALQWWIPDIKTRREAIFAGHFGPMGVGAIFISTLAATKLPTPSIPPETSMDILALTIQPITYFIVLSSILTHGLTISFFSLGRRVHSRVTSISRTFTAASNMGDEPSWMSRVKRARNPQDIVVNRDDDDDSPPVDPADVAEKGEGDSGMLAMFGAPSGGGSGSGSGSGTMNDVKFDDDKERDEMAHEGRTNGEEDNEEHPSKNVLWSDEDADVERKERAEATRKSEAEQLKMDKSSKERRYCAPGETQTWTEGRKIIIDRNDGGEVEVIDMDPSDEAASKATKHPSKSVVQVPDSAVEAELRASQPEPGQSAEQREESALKKAAYQMIRKGSLAAGTQAAIRAIKPKDDGLTPAQREEKAKQKLVRDAWCRQEKHYREDGSTAPPREWLEGSKVVQVAKGGEEITVRELTQAEKDARAAKHVAALKALGHPIDAVEGSLAKLSKSISKESGDYFSPAGPGKGKGKGKATSPPVPSPPLDAGPSKRAPVSTPPIEEAAEEEEPVRPPPSKGLGLALTRTIRPDEASDDSDSAESVVVPQPPPRAARRPSPARGNSKMNTMRHLFKRGDSRSPETMQRGRASAQADEHSRSSSPAIRFTTPDRPSRDGGTGTGRPLPVVGGSLSMRKTSTLPKS